MEWTRQELKEQGKLAFKANYWKCVLVGVVLSIITVGGSAYNGTKQAQNASSGEDSTNAILDIINSNPAYATGLAVGVLVFVAIALVIGLAFTAFITNPLTAGCRYFYYKNLESPQNAGLMGFSFSNSYMPTVKTLFIMSLKLIGWTLLLIIPGIIKAYEYAMIPYIVADNPGIDTKEAFAMSREMMTGNKWAMFVLQLSFIGWDILAAITLGIVGIFYSGPYQYSTEAALYKRLKGETAAAEEPVIEAVDADYTTV